MHVSQADLVKKFVRLLFPSPSSLAIAVKMRALPRVRTSSFGSIEAALEPVKSQPDPEGFPWLDLSILLRFAVRSLSVARPGQTVSKAAEGTKRDGQRYAYGNPDPHPVSPILFS
jgi:hypothetical protein